MRDKLVLRLLGLFETTQYTLEQSHGVPPVSVAYDNTTLMEEDACGYSSIKTVRSIDVTQPALNVNIASRVKSDLVPNNLFFQLLSMNSALHNPAWAGEELARLDHLTWV